MTSRERMRTGHNNLLLTDKEYAMLYNADNSEDIKDLEGRIQLQEKRRG
jgi:hypothetical protein